jgi:glycosyltransferase involved in cell wall biosynthesis
MSQKVGIFIRSLRKGGAEKQAVELSKVFSESYDVKLIVLFKEGALIDEANTILPKEHIIFIGGANYLSKALHFFYYLKKTDLDVLLCYLPSNNIFGTLVGKMAGIKVVFGGLRGAEVKSQKIKMLVQKWVLNNFASAVISNSYMAKKAYSSFGVDEKKIHVIHNGIESNQALVERNEKSIINILSVGRFVAEKDYKTALLAIKKVLGLNKVPVTLSYTIIGYGEKEGEIRSMIQKYGLSEFVEVIINPIDVEKYYIEADVFLMTSKFEGMPNVVMEAMNYSLPVVTTNAGDVSYLVKDGENGFICPVGNSQFISEKLLELLSSFSLRKEFGKNSHEIIKSDFSLERLKRNYESLIEMYIQ